MKKTLLSLLLCLALLSSAAWAQPLQSAAPASLTLPDGLERLQRFASWQVSEDGTWTVRSYQSEAALSQLAQEGPATGVAYLDLELQGDLQTGVIQPMLVCRYLGPRSLNADSVSVVIGANRYDFRAFGVREALDDVTVEAAYCPLNAQGLGAMRSLATATTAYVRVLGDMSYGFSAVRRDSYTATKAQIEGSSLLGIQPMLDELDALGVTSYGLWDLSEKRAKRLYGFEPEMAITRMGRTDGAVTFNTTFEMLSRGDDTAGVRQLQALLIDAGFMQGRPDGNFGEGTVNAVRAARRYWGLMACGIADQLLVDCLRGRIQRSLSGNASPERTLEPLGTLCAVAVDRCWFAQAVSTAGGDVRGAENRDNALLIFEGEIENTSPDELAFYRQLTAELTLDGARYTCMILCETDDGARFDATMLPGARARLIVCAEIPARLASREGWTLTLASDGASAEWTK